MSEYCSLNHNESWRGSTFRLIFSDFCACLDFKAAPDGTGAHTTNMSFDGAGCLALQLPVPQELAASLLALVPRDQDSAVLLDNDCLASDVAAFFAGAKDSIPEIWHEDFEKYGVCRMS